MNSIRQVYKAITRRIQAATARLKRHGRNASDQRAFTDVQRLSSYIYTPLPKADSFRLIELLPGIPGSPLRCNIILTRRNRNVAGYEALSYAWGDPVFSQLLVEMSTMSIIRITDNLYHALQALRREHQSRLLWVDAVCIAQGDMQEKGHQVRQMSLIYREAQSVVVWIGKDDELGILEHLICLSGSPSDPNDCEDDDDNIRYIAYTNGPHYIWYRYCRLQDVENFLGQPWFSRVWVVQEFVLAKQLHIHVGEASMSGQSFFRAIAFCLGSDKRLNGAWFSLHHNLNRTLNLIAFREFHKQERIDAKSRSLTTEGKIHMARCLNLLEERQCSDDRDRFYALLGLLTTNTGIKPNYALDISQVRMDVTKKTLLTGDLSILDYSESFTTTAVSASCPSFIVRIPFADPEQASYWLPWALSARESGSLIGHTIKFCALQVCDTGHKTIGFKGVAIDRVSEMIYFNKKAGADGELELSCKQETLDDFHFHPGEDLTLGLNILEIYKYISSVRSRRFNLSPSEHEIFKRGFWRTVNAKKARTALVNFSPMNDFESLLLNCKISTGVVSERTFFMTELGFFGICSRWTRKGDHVVLFGGMPKPYTLRPVEGDDGQRMWKLIGDCFIEDCMEGHYFEPESYDTCGREVDKNTEAMPDERFPGRTKKLREEQFILC